MKTTTLQRIGLKLATVFGVAIAYAALRLVCRWPWPTFAHYATISLLAGLSSILFDKIEATKATTEGQGQ